MQGLCGAAQVSFWRAPGAILYSGVCDTGIEDCFSATKCGANLHWNCPADGVDRKCGHSLHRYAKHAARLAQRLMRIMADAVSSGVSCCTTGTSTSGCPMPIRVQRMRQLAPVILADVLCMPRSAAALATICGHHSNSPSMTEPRQQQEHNRIDGDGR